MCEGVTPFRKYFTAIFFSLLAVPALLPAQNKGKYPALLWEISGNGLGKPSYLYGTMHVSNKLAFHLSDSFFIALKSADIVALETNPQEWLQNMKEMGMFDMSNDYSGLFSFLGNGGGDFYGRAFDFSIPDNKDLGRVLASDPDLVNGLLYRSYEPQGNHEENTYLDLFIFQTARKLDKPVSSLEDFKQSEKMVQEAMVPDPNEEQDEQKYYKSMLDYRGSTQEKIEDAYRRGDLDALDSLSRLTYPSRKYEKYMLHLRNEVMVRGMDSIMKNQVLFTGVGAAHLPGEKGVIELLRKKGYRVRPVAFKVTKKSIREKEKIEKTFKTISYATRFAPDSSFKLDMPDRLIETSNTGNTRYYLCTDMVNGAYFMVARIKSFAAYNGQSIGYTMSRLDSLLYESIPGKIIKNTRITANNGWPGFDIVNQTRRGDIQRYRIFAGPQEIFVFKMGGTGEYVKGNEGEKFFSSILFTQNKKTGWARFTPPNGGFSAELPPNVLYEKIKSRKTEGQAEKFQALDPATGDFYMGMRAFCNDFKYIEEDTFELNMFVNSLLEKKNMELTEKNFSEGKKEGTGPFVRARLKDKNNGKPFYVNIYIRGPHYYMLAARTADGSYPQRFFDSFRAEDFKFTGTFKNNSDSTMLFDVNDEYGENEESLASNLINQRLYGAFRKKDKKEKNETYKAVLLEKNFYSPSSNENIRVEYRKFNDYRMEKSKEEFWKNELDYITEENGLVIKEKQPEEKGSMQRYDLLLTDTASSRAIKTRIILRDGAEWTLQTTTDSTGKLSFWADNFFKTFHPKDTVIGKNMFEDKLDGYLADLLSKDSSKREAALNSGDEMIFKKQRLGDLMKFMEKSSFTGIDLNTRAWLIGQFRDESDDKIISFLQKQYDNYTDTSTMQFAILAALASQKKESASRLFVQLLKKETPLTSDEYEINAIFSPFYDSLVFAKYLFPDLLELTKFEEYKSGIYTLLAALVSENLMSGGAYVNYKPVIQNEANYELKRFNASEENNSAYDYRNNSNDRDYSGDRTYNEEYDRRDYYPAYFDRSDLENYAALLIPFYSEAPVRNFFSKLMKTRNDNLLMNVSLMLLKNKLPVNDTLWSYFSKNEKTRLSLYDQLEKEKQQDKFDSTFRDQESFCRAILYAYDYSNNEGGSQKDSIVFVTKKYVKNKEEDGYVYFFKRRSGGDKKEWKLDYAGLQPADEKKVKTEARYSRKGLPLYEDKTLDEQISDIVKELNLKGRKRAESDYDFSYAGY